MNDLTYLTLRTVAVVALSLLLSLSWTDANAQETCERTGIEFGFFNGVQTTRFQARAVVEEFLPSQYGRTTPDGQPISYTLYYNDNQAGIIDFVETFEQRLQEQNGLLAGRFELFFSAMNGGGGWWSRITEAVPALGGLLSGLFDTFRSYLIRDMTADFGNPNTAVVSQRHREQIDFAAAMDKGLLLFAHSQGNLFVNQAHDHALTRVGPDSVRVVHVAPASPRATGPHALADLDLVINGLRTVGAVLPITSSIPGFLTRMTQVDLSAKPDPLGHGLLETYLNRNFQPSAHIRADVVRALEELRSPRRVPAAPYPPFVPNPWQGGTRPEFTQQFSEAFSHYLERLSETHSRGGTWSFYRLPWATNGRWSGGWNRVGPFPGKWDNYETEFSSQASGPGVNGSRVCRSSQTVVHGEATRTVHARRSCVYQRYLVLPSHLASSPRELPFSAALGAVRHLNSATWGPDSSIFERRFDNGREVRWVTFLDGERSSEAIVLYRRNPLGGFNDGFYAAETLLLRSTDTVRERRDDYSYSSAASDNQAAISSWDASYRSWLTTEVERFRTWSQMEAAHRQRAQRCMPPPPPSPPSPGGCTSEQLEDPDADCMLPS